jgi:uncharacterized membrane protein YkgB
MLTATQFFTNTPLLQTILWIEAVIYLGIGLYEVFDDFLEKPKQWMQRNGRNNGWLMLEHKVGHKMHAGICVLLGFVALNGALEGQVTRFELELIFLSFAMIMPVIWATFMPGRLGFVVVGLKPEFWLQIVMFAFFGHLIRPEILLLCIAFNVWGIAVYFLHTRRTYLQPYTYEVLRSHLADVEPERVQRLDRIAGRRLSGEPLGSEAPPA